jgi:hypothetical protein
MIVMQAGDVKEGLGRRPRLKGSKPEHVVEEAASFLRTYMRIFSKIDDGACPPLSEAAVKLFGHVKDLYLQLVANGGEEDGSGGDSPFD